MRLKSFAGMRCSIAGALEMVGDKWTILLLRDLALGVHRYDDLRGTTGIPHATLATRLKALEAYGLTERVRYQDRPPRDEYRLTDKGRDFWKVTTALREWGDRWDVCGHGAQTVKVVDHDTERELHLALVDPRTGRAVPRERVRYRPGPGADQAITDLLDSFNKGANA